jgi:hypothetical protein
MTGNIYAGFSNVMALILSNAGVNWLVADLIRLLEGVFVVGAIGSTVVLVLTTIEDTKTLFGKDDSHAEH